MTMDNPQGILGLPAPTKPNSNSSFGGLSGQALIDLIGGSNQLSPKDRLSTTLSLLTLLQNRRTADSQQAQQSLISGISGLFGPKARLVQTDRPRAGMIPLSSLLQQSKGSAGGGDINNDLATVVQLISQILGENKPAQAPQPAAPPVATPQPQQDSSGILAALSNQPERVEQGQNSAVTDYSNQGGGASNDPTQLLDILSQLLQPSQQYQSDQPIQQEQGDSLGNYEGGGMAGGGTLLRVGERNPADKNYATDEYLYATPGSQIVVAPRPQGEAPTLINAAKSIIGQVAGGSGSSTGMVSKPTSAQMAGPRRTVLAAKGGFSNMRAKAGAKLKGAAGGYDNLYIDPGVDTNSYYQDHLQAEQLSQMAAQTKLLNEQAVQNDPSSEFYRYGTTSGGGYQSQNYAQGAGERRNPNGTAISSSSGSGSSDAGMLALEQQRLSAQQQAAQLQYQLGQSQLAAQVAQWQQENQLQTSNQAMQARQLLATRATRQLNAPGGNLVPSLAAILGRSRI